MGTLALTLEQPVLFHLVAEARRLSLLGKGSLSVLSSLIGVRRQVRIEADVELTELVYNLHLSESGIHTSISDIHIQLARDGSVSCRSSEGGLVEWLLRAIPAKIVEWLTHVLRQNLSKKQLLAQWQSDSHVLGALDGASRQLSRLEQLKRAAMQRYGDGHGKVFG